MGGIERCPAHGRGRVSGFSTVSIQHTSSSPSKPSRKRLSPGEHLEELRSALIPAVLRKVDGENFTRVLVGTAIELQAETAAQGMPDHQLCEILADMADSIDPASISGAFGEVFEGAIVEAGAPRWVAQIAGWGIAKAAQQVAIQMLPGPQLCLGLRVLGILVCPDPSICPVANRLSASLVSAALDEAPNNGAG